MRENEKRKFITEVAGIKDPDILETLMKNTMIRVVPEKTYIYRAGDKPDSIMILMKGIFAFYYSNTEENKERIEWICSNPGQVAIDYNDYMNRKPFCTDMKAITECTFMSIPYDALFQVLERSEELATFVHKLLIDANEDSLFLRRLSFMTSHERVRTMYEVYSEVVPYLTHLEIAQFLNMSRSNFERCLSEIYKEQNK